MKGETHWIHQSSYVPSKLQASSLSEQRKGLLCPSYSQAGRYFCKAQYEPESNMYCQFSYCPNIFCKQGIEVKVAILTFTHACKMLFPSHDSGIYWFRDFRAQGINALIMKHNHWFKLRLAMSGFSVTGPQMNMKKKKKE